METGCSHPRIHLYSSRSFCPVCLPQDPGPAFPDITPEREDYEHLLTPEQRAELQVMQDGADEDWLTIPEVALLVGYSPGSIKNLLSTGQMDCSSRLRRGRREIYKLDALAWLRDRPFQSRRRKRAA